jgi:hypothetical protein
MPLRNSDERLDDVVPVAPAGSTPVAQYAAVHQLGDEEGAGFERTFRHTRKILETLRTQKDGPGQGQSSKFKQGGAAGPPGLLGARRRGRRHSSCNSL